MWSRLLRRTLLRLLLSSAIVALFLCIAPTVARAQVAITIYQETSLPRVNFNANGALVQVAKRALNLTPEGVNYQDCLDNVRIRFPVQLSGSFTGNDTFEVWAGLSGSDCSDQRDRTSSTSPTCWPLATGLPKTLNQNVDIPVRTIMSGIKDKTKPDDSASICGTVDLTTIAVNFLYFAAGQTSTPSTSHAVSVQVDTVGPSAPTGLSSLPGNTRLIMNWDSISGESGVSVLTGIRVYCDPNHSNSIPAACAKLIAERAAVPLSDGGNASTTNTPDAGEGGVTSTADLLVDGSCITETNEAGDPVSTVCDAGEDSGTDATTSTTPDVDGTAVGSGGSCETSNLAPTTGAFTPSAAFDECFSCGNITGNTGTSIVATTLRGQPLLNNTTYAIAVAATDAFDNVGPLSGLQCNYPEVTNDFWEAYKNAGGKAGGGCDTTSQSPAGSIIVFGISAAFVLARLRQRRKNRNAK